LANSYTTGTDSITIPNPGSLGNAAKLNGPSLFGATDDKYVVLDGNRILVINNAGEVWAHVLSRGSDPTACMYDTVGAGQKLSGPGVFGATDDKYVVSLFGTLYVINKLGEVWAHAMTSSTIAGGVKLSGPLLFGASDDKYVVTYFVGQ
jgi:hypothetical protein